MKDYLKKDEWKIIEDQYHPEYNQISESIFSIGNGRMGQRANFEETFSGKSLQGNYIGGIYYPDKTRVGWWKNGYPEYFAKVLNSVNWIGIKIEINNKEFDLNNCEIKDFSRVLDMKNGLLQRTTTVAPDSKTQLSFESERYYSIEEKDLAMLQFKIKNLGKKAKVTITSYMDFDVRNEDSNYDENFWKFMDQEVSSEMYWVQSVTKKTEFTVCAAQSNQVKVGKNKLRGRKVKSHAQVGHVYSVKLKENEELIITKYTAICSSFYHKQGELKNVAIKQVREAKEDGYEKIRHRHTHAWNDKWKEMDVVIEGDISAQQGIRFNIFQLYQTYTGEDPRLNIGPKGFTGEKYGGSTYWDTEAYCLPFYMSTATQEVAKNLLLYRYYHLEKAVENAEKLGFSNGAALYPMVTINGEECHNEWEITFEEIHRNGAIAYAIYDYTRYTKDESYIPEYGIDVLVGIARFWAQRVNWSQAKKAYVILGVTGPNEYENNVNNNWYTNYITKWSLQYSVQNISKLKDSHPNDVKKIFKRLNLKQEEIDHWSTVSRQMYFPVSDELGVFLQQDGYLDKEQVTVAELSPKERPINQKWSWDRILRSPFIKQADVLQGLYFFIDDFSKEVVQKNFDYYEPRTVHESSLSPCVHSILAAYLGKEEKAYEMYLRTSRLDLDDYNNDTEDGLHITSMAGSWLSMIKGFAGMRVKNDTLSFNPFLPKKWNSFAFRILYRGRTLRIQIKQDSIEISNLSKKEITLLVYNKNYTILENQRLEIKN